MALCLAVLSACSAGAPSSATSAVPRPAATTEAIEIPTFTADEGVVMEPEKECPLSSLAIADALIMAQPGSDGALEDEVTGSDSLLPISLSIQSMLWHSGAFEGSEGSDVSANLYWPSGTSASAATFGLDVQWLEGDAEPKLMVLYSTYFPDAPAKWDADVLGQLDDGTMDFGAPCYRQRFGQLADAVGRQPDLELYIDFLTEHAAYLDCLNRHAIAPKLSGTCIAGPVIAAANAIDETLPGF